MLLELRVENLLLIDRAELRFAQGLNAITGETGAGKTMLAHALDLLLGGKPKPGIVRPGAAEAYVEGVFAPPPGVLDDPALAELRERLPDDESEEIVLARRVSAEGRSRAYVQGRSATAADLAELGGRLVAFYGQHEHRRLVVSSAQLETLDAFCGGDHLAAVEELGGAHARILALERELESLRSRAGASERERDLLAYELNEIEALGPSEEEHASLAVERERLRALDGLRAASGGGAEAIAPESGEPGVASLLADAERLAEPVAGADSELDALTARLRGLRIEAEDLGAELRRYEAGLDADPGRLEVVEERLDLYDRLERKHGGSVAAVLAHAERCRAELALLEDTGAAVARLESELAEARADADARAAAVGKTRRKAAPRLARAVLSELSDLAMEGSSFEVRIEGREARARSGDERVEFLISPNAGVAPQSLRETASGGESSRVMLALMTVASGGGARALVFDEVDAGIGGQTARVVGEKLRALAAGQQVLCITHLPQIASLAERHFSIEKHQTGDLARAEVAQLDGDAVVDELCRMLGADGADGGARRHAEELLAAA
ncbi:MAG TPA: DNA repair protein RecN [Thermoleophilaceae bacterium]|nr:DNA repair protein RecN [Thermoleophilaceae bacterium]